MISAKANFLITLLHRKPRSKGEREGGRGRGTRLISGLRFFYRGRVRLKQAGPFCHLLRSITTVLLSTAATIRIVCQRPINVASKISGRKKSWLEERGDGGPPFFFQLAKRKQITPPPPFTLRPRLFVPSRITPLDESSRLSFVFANQRSSLSADLSDRSLRSFESTRYLGLLRVRSGKIKLVCSFVFFFLLFFPRLLLLRSIFFGRLNNIGVNF